MTTTLSQLRTMINSTLIHAATNDQSFDDLAVMCGLPRPFYLSRNAWRKALLAGYFGKRATPGCAWAFLEGALSDYATTITAVLNPAFPTRLYSPTSVFSDTYIGRLVRIPDYGLFRIASASAATNAEYVTLVTTRTLAWDVPDWSTLDASVTVTNATVLAFDVHEPTTGPGFDTDPSAAGIEASNPALYQVMLWPDIVSTAPPTFVQDGSVLTFTVDAGTDVITTDGIHQYDVDDPIEFAPQYQAEVTAVDTGTNTLTSNGHGKSAGNEVQFGAGPGGVLPSGIDPEETYVVSASGLTANDFRVTKLSDGTALFVVDAGTSPFYVFPAGPDTLPSGLVEGTRYLVETVYSDIATQLTAPMNGLSLPQAEIFVEQTAGMSTSGTVYVTTADGVQRVTYTDITDTSLLGCEGGTGVMSTGGSVYTSISFSVKTVAGVHVDITDAGTATNLVMRARPVGEPLGGQVQTDAAEYGNVAGDGPYPIYLIGTSAMPELAEIMEEMVPLGVRVEVRVYRDLTA